MADFSAIKATIDANVTTNGDQEITGAILNSVLKGIVDAVNGKKSDPISVLSQVQRGELIATITIGGDSYGIYSGEGMGKSVDETGFFVVDENYRIGMKYDGNGLDFAQISDHAISLLKDAGLGKGEFGVDVVEDGFYFIDSQYNIGVKVDQTGLHAINFLEYEIVNI